MASILILAATYYRADIRHHIADLLTSVTSRPSPPLLERRSSRDVTYLRRRRDVIGDDHGKFPAVGLSDGIVQLYNCRRRQYVAVATRYDVTVKSRDGTSVKSVLRRKRRQRRHMHAPSVHFSNQMSCSSCKYGTRISYVICRKDSDNLD